MNTHTIPLNDIWPGDRLREVDEDWAAVLAESMAVQGQMTPIEVRATPDKVRPYALVSGAHRYRALELIEAEAAVAILFEGDELAAKLREIDENLMRHELTALDRATFLAERKAIYEQLNPETGRGKYSRSGKNDKVVVYVPSFSESTAERLGFDKRTIERAVRRHAALDADVRRRLSGTWLADNGQQLDLLAACSQADQRGAVDLLFGDVPDGAKRPKSVGDALDQVRGVAALPINKDDAKFAAFASLWRKASPSLKRRIRAFINKEAS